MDKKNTPRPPATEAEKADAVDKAVQALWGCDSLTLSAALSMLPDYMDEGASVVLSAAARILAERFKDLPKALEQFGKLVRENREIIEKQKG